MLTRRGLALSAAAMGIVTACPRTAAAQHASGLSSVTPPSLDDQFFAEGRYLPRYLDLRAKAEGGDPMARGALSQYAAFLGDEATATGMRERPRAPDQALPDLADAVSVDALEAIVKAAADSKIVILNEAHNVSGHRAFANRVMRALRPLGFDWFAAEAFTPPQQEPFAGIEAYREGGAFGGSFGYYTFDPVYAEMVREAARLGFRFAAYEERWDQTAPESANGDETIAIREAAQADNLIEAILKPHPDAKIFVYCGYNHAMERHGDGGEWFAARLKAKSGIDPLTIEQSGNWPGTRPESDAPHVAAVLSRFAPTMPIAVSRHGEIVSSPRNAGRMDMSVFHPRLPEVSGRPGWLAADPERRAVTVALPPFDGPTLIQAMRTGEGAGAIPADQFLLEPGQDRATLFLHPGPYLLRMERAGGIDPAFGSIKVEA